MVAQTVFAECEEQVPQARERMDEGQEQWERVRRRLAPRPQAKRLCIADLCRAYEEATGTWIGCD